MGEHPYIKEKEIDRLTQLVDGDNGNPGIRQDVLLIKRDVADIKKTLGEWNITMQGFKDFISNFTIAEGVKQKTKLDSRQKVKIYMSLIISGAAVIISLLQYFK